MQLVGARLGNCTNHTAGAAAVRGAVRIGIDAEFLESIDAEENPSGAARRIVVGVVDVAPIEDEADLARSIAVDD